MSVKRDPGARVGVPELPRGATSTPRRRRNPQGQGGRLRAELIAAADQILARTGDVEGLSLRAVAREVGIATPSVYLHFPDKSALVHEVLSVRFAELGAAVQEAVTNASGPAEQLRAGCRAYCRFATEQPNAYRVLFGRLPHSPERPGRGTAATPDDASPTHPTGTVAPGAPDAGRVPEPGATAFRFLVDGVAACMDAGVTASGDPMRVATNVWTALHGIVSLRAASPGFPWPDLDGQIDDVLDGLAGLHHNRDSSAS